MTNDEAPQLDQLPTAQVVDLLLSAEERVVPTLRSAADAIARAATIMSKAFLDGGRFVFAGAGTSGRLASAEAAELPGTFGVPASRCIALLAGTSAAIDPIDDSAEDDAAGGAADVRAVGVAPGDVLVAVAASGRTPYTLAAAQTSLDAGAQVVAIVTVKSSPLAALATVRIEVPVGEEVLRGSTRLTAGTAQKIALNTLTTAAMSRAGRVHGHLMIDVVAANTKLQARAAGIVAEIAGCSQERAAAALEACGGDARGAVLHLARGLSPAEAVALATGATSLREALDTAL